mgnify:FL=1
MAITPTLYSIDIVEQQKIEQPRLFYIDIVETHLSLSLPLIYDINIVETHLPISVPLLYDINVSWFDYINDSNALFAFSGL